MKRNDELFISTSLTRPDLYGGMGQFDVTVHFKLTHYSEGCRASYDDPGYGPEFEFDFLRAEFDGDHDDAPEPMTAAETEHLRKWFYSDGYDKACKAATREIEEERRYG